MEIEFTNLLAVVAVGFAAPLLLGLAPALALLGRKRQEEVSARAS